MASHAVTVELFYNGIWNIVPAYVRDGTRITHGRGNEMSEPVPSSGALTLDSRVTSHNPGNPLSPLYGVAGRNTPTRITVDGAVRLYGEGAGWKPQRSENFALGNPVRGDRWTEIEAAGTLRRLGQGATPLRSALYRHITTAAPLPVAYWPLEDGIDATQAASGLLGGTPMSVQAELIDFTDQAPPGAAGGATPSRTVLGVATGSVTGTGTEWQVCFWARGVVQTSGTQAYVYPLRINTTSPNLKFWLCALHSPVPAAVTTVAVAYDQNDSSVSPFLEGAFASEPALMDGNWHLIQVTAKQNGANVDAAAYVDGVLIDSATYANKTVGFPTSVASLATFFSLGAVISNCLDVTISHVSVYATATLVNQWTPGQGHAGELAAARLARLATEQGETITVLAGDTEPMGPQRVDTFMDLLREIERTDDGILYEPRTAPGLAYRPRTTLYNQTPVLTLNFAIPNQVAYPLDPAVDDLNVRNDVTVQRRNGSSARAVLESGRLSVQPPPAGVGRVDTKVDVNTATDDVLSNHAFWHLAKGTVDATRYPRVTVDLDANPSLAAAATGVSIGDLIEIRNTEEGGALLLVLGYTETIGSHRRKITFNCAPADPYAAVGVLDSTSRGRLDTAGCTLNTAEDTVSTAWDLNTSAGPLWSTVDEPYDLAVAGERVTVTVNNDATNPQSVTVTRSVNGVVKAQVAGATVRLFTPLRLGL